MLGSDGDVLPFTRLARALRDRGHAVTVHTWAQYHPWFPSAARLVAPVLDVSVAQLHACHVEALALATPWDQIARFARTFYGLDHAPAARRAAFAAASDAARGHDVAVCDVLDPMGQLACDATRVPWYSWASRPAPDPRDVDGPLAATDRALSTAFTEATGAPQQVATFRARGPLGDLVNASPTLVLPHPHHPEAIVTGPWWAAAATAPAPLPPALAAFLDAGPPPVLVSFGTVPDLSGRARALLAAAARTGWRAILQVLPPEPPPRWVPPTALVVRERLPFATLLPRVAALVHHGGAGTVHEATRAGCPSLTMPHMADQYCWARAAATRGLGPPPLHHAVRDLATLDAAFDALRAPAWRERALALGPRIAAEDGITATVARLEATRP